MNKIVVACLIATTFNVTVALIPSYSHPVLITAEAIDEANKACEKRGGVRVITTNAAFLQHIPSQFLCMDYAKFTINNKGERLP